MGRVLVTGPLPPGSLDPVTDAGHEVVTRSGRDLREAIRGVDAVICLLTDRIDSGVIAAGGDRLRVIANVAVGYDNIDVGAAAEAGVIVCNTPGVLDETTADLAFLLILAASRLAHDAESDVRSGRWKGWDVNDYLGHDVHGRVIGVVGWGRIGRAVGRRAEGFDMTVLHHARTPTGDPGFVESLDDLLARVDIVTLHVPLTSSTHHLLDARRLALLRPDSVLVNTSRGPVVDEAALADALHAGRLFAAGLDVYENEPAPHSRLLDAPRTVLLPHIGSATVQTRTAMGRLAARSVVDVLTGAMPATVVTR